MYIINNERGIYLCILILKKYKNISELVNNANIDLNI